MKKDMTDSMIVDRLIACDPMVYCPIKQGQEVVSDIDDLKHDMQRLNIASSIVRHGGATWADPYFCNDDLMKKVSSENDVIPAWFITVDGKSPAFDMTEIFADMSSNNVKIVWADFVARSTPFQDWCCHDLFEGLQKRNMPLMLGCRNINMTDLHHVMTAFPRLRIILLDLPRTGRQATIESLLQAHSELFLCFSPSFAIHGGYKSLCDRYGEHRWVWGMGYPVSEGGAALTGLIYSGLNKKQMNAVAYQNIERLLSEVTK